MTGKMRRWRYEVSFVSYVNSKSRCCFWKIFHNLDGIWNISCWEYSSRGSWAQCGCSVLHRSANWRNMHYLPTAEILFDWKAIRNQANLVWWRHGHDICDSPNGAHSRGEQNTIILYFVPSSKHLSNSRQIYRATVAEIACVFFTSRRGRRTGSREKRKIVTTNDVHRSKKCICRRHRRMK